MHLQVIKNNYVLSPITRIVLTLGRPRSNERFNAVNMAHMNRKRGYGQKPRTDRQK